VFLAAIRLHVYRRFDPRREHPFAKDDTPAIVVVSSGGDARNPVDVVSAILGRALMLV
jgi:hypothetical protein